jgi:peroxiredoxin Q/BCP
MKAAVGDKAPVFQLKNQEDVWVNLNDFLGKIPLVIYFYPKNFTPGCVAEACSFRDQFEDFTDLGAMVIGISADSVNSHARFVKKYKLPFTMLADIDNKVRKLFDVKGNFMGLIPGRETFVIDAQGIIQMRFDSLLATKHIPKALKMLQKVQHGK